jgi:hypothetical protein
MPNRATLTRLGFDDSFRNGVVQPFFRGVPAYIPVPCQLGNPWQPDWMVVNLPPKAK